VVTEPGTIEVREYPLAPPEPGWALLRILRAGICGTDLHTIRGDVRQYVGTQHERTLSYPIICGHENVAIVEATGGEVLDAQGRPVASGDRVVPGANVACGECFYCRNGFPYYACERLEDYGNSLGAAQPPHLFGGWSEFMYVMPGSRLFRVPEAVPDEIAALTEPMAVTHGLDRIRGLAGSTVYVLGCGPLGACHIAKSRLLGAERVLSADRFRFRLDVARDLGASEVFDVGQTDERERLEAVRAATGGRGADVVVDAAGSPQAFREGLRALRFGGTLIEAGAFVGSRPAEIDLAAEVCLKDARIIGVGGEDDAAYAPALQAMAEQGEDLRLGAIVTHVLPLERVAEGVRLASRGEAMKVQLAPDGMGPSRSG
jgi:L-iditol 2-dehydrogenase